MKRTLSLLLLLIGFTTVAQSPFETADSLVNTNRLGNAFKAINILHAQEKTVDYYVVMAKALVVRRRPILAHEMADSAMLLFENESRGYWVKGYILISYNKSAEAIPYLSKSIELKDNGEARFWRGVAYHNLKDINAAIDDYRAAVSLGLESQALYNNLGIALANENQLQESEDVFSMAVILDPTYSPAYSGRASTRLLMGSVDSACADIAKANFLGNFKTPTIPDSLCTASENFKMIYAFSFASYFEKHEAIVDLFNRIPDKSKLGTTDSLNYGFALLSVGELEKSEAVFLHIERNLEGQPDTMRHILYNDMSELYMDMQDYNKVIEYNDKFMAFFGDKHIPLHNRALGYLYLGKEEEALRDINRAIEVRPNYIKGFATRGQIKLAMGEYQSALDDINHAIRLDPNFNRAYALRAAAKEALGIPDYCSDVEKARSLGLTDIRFEGCSD
ncbi:MAG: tetratricopeptide repeat protein [Flavobacteriia bacterium]|nr:tetratricopeptide repeat protein [Flavobacteriia bacterium]